MQAYVGHFREHCFNAQAGRTLTLTVHSPHAVRLNVHHHGPTNTIFLIDEVVEQSTSNTLEFPSDGEYCFEVKNPENRASAYELRLEYRISAD